MKKLRSALPLPYYVRRKWLSASAQWAYFFEPPTWARRAGCTVKAEPLGTDYNRAVERAETVLLPAFRSWQTAGASDMVMVSSGPAAGSFDWLTAQYRASAKFLALSVRDRRDHERRFKGVADVMLKDGRRFGEVQLVKIHEGVVDRLYETVRFVREIEEDGQEKCRERLTTANHMMASCQRAWNVVRRLHPEIVPPTNPFSKMERKHSHRVTPAATYGQLQAFVAACDAAGHRSIGTAALIAWHWCLREEHILGQQRNGSVRALLWEDYRPSGAPETVVLRHWKTGVEVPMPLLDGAGMPLFPELTARLDGAIRHGAFIVMRDNQDRKSGANLTWVTKTGDLTYFRHLVRRIMKTACLPPKISFASFRHGGVTESGDADLTDRQMLALSGHKTVDILDIYAKRTLVQRQAAAAKRRDYRTKRAQ